jgi:hypothetical protein
MSIKSEIAWRRPGPDGERIQVYARRFGKQWQFYWRYRRAEDWQPLEPVPLEDWLELLDAVRRRVPRRLYPPDEVDRIRKVIRERYPEAADQI